MGKKKKDHRARVAKRNLRQEAAAWGDLVEIYEKLKEKYDDPAKALEENPELAQALSPFALRPVALAMQNMKKYGKKD